MWVSELSISGLRPNCLARKEMHKLCVFLLVFCGYTFAENPDLDKKIEEVFKKQDPESKPYLPYSRKDFEGLPGRDSCNCVPYYLCNNGSVNTNGEGIIDIR